MFIKNTFGELIPLSNKMQAELPGASIESGYAISGPDDAGYFGIRGPGLPSAAFIPGDVPYRLPETNQLIYRPYTAPVKPISKAQEKKGFPLIGWVALAIIVFLVVSN
jgi:hypothetical protein